MGLEGAASTAYFSCLSGLVPPEVAFDGRSRRPPKDLANAALSTPTRSCWPSARALYGPRARDLARGAARLHRQASQPLPGPLRGGPAWPPRWRGGATGSRSPLSNCGWSPLSSTRCAGRSPRSSTRPTTSSTSTRYATPAWRAARSTGPRPHSTTPGCTEGYGEPAARRERAAHRRIPSRLQRRPRLARRSVPPAAVTSLAMVTALTPFAMLPSTIAVARISISFRTMNTQRLSRLFPKQISW